MSHIVYWFRKFFAGVLHPAGEKLGLVSLKHTFLLLPNWHFCSNMWKIRFNKSQRKILLWKYATCSLLVLCDTVVICTHNLIYLVKRFQNSKIGSSVSSLPIDLTGSSNTGHSFTLFTTITNVNCIVALHHSHNNPTRSHRQGELRNASFVACSSLQSPLKTNPD